VPSSAEELVKLLDIEAIEENLFRGQQPDTAMQRVFGGQVAGQAMVAATRTAPADMEMHSLHSYFLRPGDTAVPIIYDVDRVREGRSFATRRVIARQHGKPIFGLTASFQRPEPGVDHQVAMPDVASPGDCKDLFADFKDSSPEGFAFWLREWAALEIRAASGHHVERIDLAEPSRAQYWMRSNGVLDDDVLTHKAVLTYASDMMLLGSTLIPHGKSVSNPGVQAASLDHAIWFHRPFRADEWLLYDLTSPSAQGARGLAHGRFFSEDGRLIATVMQEGLIRVDTDSKSGIV
jgi:acyl-CoA thioesterase-2